MIRVKHLAGPRWRSERAEYPETRSLNFNMKAVYCVDRHFSEDYIMIADAINEIHVLTRSIIPYLYATHAGTLFVSYIPTVYFFSLTYFLNLSLVHLYMILYYYIIFRQSSVSLFDNINCWRLRGTETVTMPSMTDCYHVWLPYGKSSVQAEQATIRVMGRVKTISHAKLRARLPVPNTTPIVARSKVAAMVAGSVASAEPFALLLFLSFMATQSLRYSSSQKISAVLEGKRCETIFTEGARQNV